MEIGATKAVQDRLKTTKIAESKGFGSLRKNRFSKDGVAIKVQLCYDKSNNT